MPLHLLGKKSWNVYNTANIERVRRDEAAAAAKEAAEEQRMQEEDAHRRLQLLRGVSPSKIEPLERPPDESDIVEQPREHVPPAHDRKRRKLRGENDTDRDIRYAKEDNANCDSVRKGLSLTHKSTDAPITDSHGHIALFTPSSEADAGKLDSDKLTSDAKYRSKSRPTKDDSFKAAAGEAPWYSSGRSADPPAVTGVGKDVWGNEDPSRKGRDMSRLMASDPLLAMNRGVQGVRQAEREKKRLGQKRDREITDMIREERRTERRKRHADRRSSHHERSKRRSRSRSVAKADDADSLEDFRLDSPRSTSDGSKHERRRHHGDRHDEGTHRDRRREHRHD